MRSTTCFICSPDISALIWYVSICFTSLPSMPVFTSPPVTTGNETSSGSLSFTCRRMDAISNLAIDTSAFGFISTVIRPFPKRLTDDIFSTPFTAATNASMREVTFCSMTFAEAFRQE